MIHGRSFKNLNFFFQKNFNQATRELPFKSNYVSLKWIYLRSSLSSNHCGIHLPSCFKQSQMIHYVPQNLVFRQILAKAVY
ncbi:MAG TPA: hypothetical protein DHV39_11900 [Verrucomicrobiales bacterium]|nr:hypothetical protein [Verrucomicrobiales bacterium]